LLLLLLLLLVVVVVEVVVPAPTFPAAGRDCCRRPWQPSHGIHSPPAP